MTTHILSLSVASTATQCRLQHAAKLRRFLPVTIRFDRITSSIGTPIDSKSSSPPAGRQARKPPPAALDLASSRSCPSLFSGPTANPPLTPSLLAHEAFFTANIDAAKVHFAKPGDTRTLVRSEAHVPEWGTEQILNQPPSAGGLLPSSSILDFAKVYADIQRQRDKAREERYSPSAIQSRAQSRDRSFEGKAWTIVPAIHGNGGLRNAIHAIGAVNGMEVSWIGTPGFPTDGLSKGLKADIADKLINEHDSVAVFVGDQDLDGHYAHYCKIMLWPIFHYQTPDHPKSKAYADHSFHHYVKVNQAFADQAVASYKRGDTIWVNDYHLLLAPAMIRNKLPDAQIGFFLHAAFPSSEIFRCLSTRQALLQGMLGANLIAFQTDEYAQHFLQTCSRLLTVEATVDGVQLEDRFVNVTSEPIGIDPIMYDAARSDPEVQEWIAKFQDRYKGKHIIVARDKLDSVRGVRQKLLSYELFLKKYPKWRDQVVLIQVAGSGTDKPQSDLLNSIAKICIRIDEVYSSLAHTPLVFLKQDISYPQHVALLTIADVMMISALRDGMNLTAHEYIYYQDGKDSKKKHGPLILSEFTGSASVLGGAHLSINPWNFHEQADAIKQALEMSKKEKSARWKILHDAVMTNSGVHWMQGLSQKLAKAYTEHTQTAAASVPRLSITRLSTRYCATDQRLFLIDYERTLAPHRTSTGIALSSPQRVLDTLRDLMIDTKNIVYIMSGRRPEELQSIFRTLPALGLIAENGCFVREAGSETRTWENMVDKDAASEWKDHVKVILKYHLDRLEGSYVEERRCSLFFRYENAVDQEAAVRFAGECADQINTACADMSIRSVPVKKALVIEQTDFSKRTAATRIFDELRKRAIATGLQLPDFMLVAGDDREDEVVFKWANDLAKEGAVEHVFTVSVGKRNTEAQATLVQGSTGLLSALQKLANISMGPDV